MVFVGCLGVVTDVQAVVQVVGKVNLCKEVADETDVLHAVGSGGHVGQRVEHLTMLHDVERAVFVVRTVGGPSIAEDVVGEHVNQLVLTRAGQLHVGTDGEPLVELLLKIGVEREFLKSCLVEQTFLIVVAGREHVAGVARLSVEGQTVILCQG